MGKSLVIVESPAKAKTVSRMLGSGYSVKASLGHVRDLPKRKLGVDVKRGFIPSYEVLKERKTVVKEIREAAQKASSVYLATDPDREGEAICWHLVQAVGLDSVPIKRVVFHEITEQAVANAFRHPREIDLYLVNAQQARRILDRLVGYEISPLLWHKVRRGLSAGRVQSAALRMIVDREREIAGFVPQEYWSIDAKLEKMATKESFTATLIGLLDGTKLEIGSHEEAQGIVSQLERGSYAVAKVREKEVARQPAPPFITSTLQQDAWRKLRFSAKHTMAIAQQLYEGLPIGEGGSVGLITYMRTDSVRVAPSAVAETRAYIKEKYGDDFLPPRARIFTKRVKGAQEAHEAIRPTSVRREPASIKRYLTRDQFRLYELIWKRMVSSQMSPALLDTTSVDIEARNDKSYLLRATSSRVKFPGFTILYSEGKDEAEDEKGKGPLPELVKGERLTLLELFPEQHFTQPPPRYTEATLVKALEERGIGRPSTYAPILSTLQERGYVTRDGGRLCPLELGFLVSDILSEHFPDIVDLTFTAQMEEGLDQIAQGERAWVPFLEEFYTPFEKTLQTAKEQMAEIPDEPADEICPNCGRPMVIKMGRYGKFIACSGYPECKTAKPIEETKIVDEPTDEVCSLCGRPMVIKSGRYGRFLSCSGYPKCKNSKPLPIGVKCPKCGGDLVERRSKRKRTFYGCSTYPDCDFATGDRPLSQPCPECGELLVMQGEKMARCTKCQFSGRLAKIEREAVRI